MQLNHDQEISPNLSSFKDCDVDSLRSPRKLIDRIDLDSDSEDDVEILGGRCSAETRAYDDGVLHQEEELENLLMKERGRRTGVLALIQRPLKILFSQDEVISKKPELEEKEMRRIERRKQRRKRKTETLLNQAENEEEVKFLSEIEEGISTDSASEAENKIAISRSRRVRQYSKKSKIIKCQSKYVTSFFIAVVVSIILLIYWRFVLNKRDILCNAKLMSNGTALFAPTTILISLDGFRADFLHRGITPRLNVLMKEGVSPSHMLPSFPSSTFPNHYTLATGLYPESHGIISNVFWDKKLNKKFVSTSPEANNPRWWGGEPIWVTAEKQGVRTAIHMWPGSETHILEYQPAFLDKFNLKTTLKEKANRVLGLLDKKGHEDILSQDSRPQLIVSYVPHVDRDGHLYGPNSTETRNTILEVDQMLDQIYLGLEQRNLTNIINLVVVSDHGMATTSINRMIQLDDIINLDEIDHIDGWPLSGLHFIKNADIYPTFLKLSRLSAQNKNFDVYLRDTNMPERYHFSTNDRIAPLWIVPKTGWAITTKKEFNIEKSRSEGVPYHPRGLHGYDHEHPLMRAIFVAKGPAFPPIPRNRVRPFQNIEVYNIICDSLGIIPKSNNGTLRLPILPINPQEPDIASEISENLDDNLSLISLEPQDTAKPSISWSENSSAVTYLTNPTNAVETEPQEVPETPSTPEINFSWLTDVEKDVWDWLKDKTTHLTNWWEDSMTEYKNRK